MSLGWVEGGNAVRQEVRALPHLGSHVHELTHLGNFLLLWPEKVIWTAWHLIKQDNSTPISFNCILFFLLFFFCYMWIWASLVVLVKLKLDVN